ncbi:MAG: tetratricopeptide repeat protein [Lachnospiraceae bacterium]|nr:tetratricopeptide repeat protein [Lachnospiraceae bacterium]
MLNKEDYEEPRCVLCMNPKSRIPVDRIMEKYDKHIEDGELERAESHLKYWLDEAKSVNDEAGEIVILGEMMGFCRKNGKKEEAFSYAKQAVSKVEKYGFGDSVTGATAILNAGTVYRTFGENEMSAALYKNAESIYEKLLDGEDERLGGLYNNFASALAQLDEYDAALDKYNKALAIMGKKENGKLECAITYLNIADLFEKKDGAEAAEEKISDMLDKAYELLTDESIERNAYFKFVLDKCIPAYDYYGQFLRSEQLKEMLS